MTEKDRLIINLEEETDDRYSRLRLIPWWDEERLKSTKVLVIGAGALGNEIMKNLALVGVGQIIILDMDSVENSNLSRSVLFREKDEGRNKAEAVAEMAREINPDCRVHWIAANAVYDLGLGVYRWADLVLGGLDNREARLSINQSCWKVNRPWIDGAIEVLFGVARVFIPPHSACYECTMNETDYKLLNQRRSCALLTRKDMLAGKVPTTPTIASVVAGIQVQEALKLIHRREELPLLEGKGYFFNGLTYDSYVVEYDRRENCPSHEHYELIEELPLKVEETTLAELLAAVEKKMGAKAQLELEKELVTELRCEKCDTEEPCFKALGRVTEDEARCERCGEIRLPEMTYVIKGDEPYLQRTLAEIGIPGLEVVAGRSGGQISYFELTGDRGKVLGPLA